VPHFVLGGQNLAGMAAFKEHATFGFWRDEDVTGSPRDTGAMGSMGRLASLADLPDDKQMAAYIKKAALCCAPRASPSARHQNPRRRSTCPRSGSSAEGQCRSARPLGRLFARQAARLYRMGARGEARGNARQTDRNDRFAGRRGQGPELEI
jgi:hypothetical protein